jgi:putative PIN family toxin of toxin-antitoxin system
MRVVIDTNVFVSACMGLGSSRTIIEACLHKQLTPLMGSALLAEYEDVLGRTPLFENCRLDAQERAELLDIFLACCEWVRVYYSWRPNLKDEGDNHVVELAVAGAARIITRNLRDFRAMEIRFPNLKVLSPEDQLKEMT